MSGRIRVAGKHKVRTAVVDLPDSFKRLTGGFAEGKFAVMVLASTFGAQVPALETPLFVPVTV